ncbi:MULTISPECIES: hypothetical protein [unclassified Corynebacterium]|nr:MULTISPECIES: hypothetical protein [unclassified Corynebacterium]MCG7263378.1 hypothetical protein [Corynebacterium sp. ACRQL]
MSKLAPPVIQLVRTRRSLRIRVLKADHEEPLPRRLPRAGKDLLDVAQRQ